ncbi:MAG TPA: DUF2182 domain-containing protein [Methylomirabilota bacterium]|nr:DUF2182 domain-containing protein [Methylomirabilota bacterium]
MTGESRLAALARRDRALTAAGLALVVGLAWLWLARAGGEMDAMAEMGMARMAPWTAADAALAAVMWAVMMTAMMLPAASPMILTFAAMNRTPPGAAAPPHVGTGLFVLGYLAVWGAFSLAAAGGQWALQAAALLSADTLRAAPLAGASLLAAAGLYQLTPLKDACLARCRTPLGFLLAEWRPGAAGALVMGLRHGLFCLGCCWVLMALLFVGGVMNLAWVAALMAFVLLEKLVPAGRVVSRASGVALLAWAGWLVWGGS